MEHLLTPKVFSLISLLILLLIYQIWVQKKGIAELEEYWQKWEREYWHLRSTTGVDKLFEIHVSWLKYGEARCIVRRKEPLL